MGTLFTDESRFWVIFDTCTLPEYYLDVHKLLALPRGATLRYNYKGKYLSSSAQSASLDPPTAPRYGLLLYAQRRGFHRGEGTPRTGTIFADMLWIPTRIVEMLCIPRRDGESFNYDFKALQYPSINATVMMRVLDPLVQRKEVPFNKWVMISSELDAFEELKQGDDRANWGSIAAEFHRPDSQFSSDVFWRIVGPAKTKTGKLIAPRYERFVDSGELRLVKAVYDIEEGLNHSFEIVSASPPRSTGSAFVQYSLRCSSTNAKTVEVIGSGTVSLRQECADNVQFVGKITKEIADHGASLRFETQPKPQDWPGGPELEVPVAVVKSRAKLVAGFIVGCVGVLAIAYGGDALKSSALTGATYITIGVCLLVISGLLISKKLSLKS